MKIQKISGIPNLVIKKILDTRYRFTQKKRKRENDVCDNTLPTSSNTKNKKM